MRKLILSVTCIVLCNICSAQISYRSKVVEDNPYVPSVDLELLREVLAKKQNAYDNNAAVLNECFASTRKMLLYIPDLNKNQLVNEYNRLAKVAGSYDISDVNVVKYLRGGLDYLDYIIGFVLKNPNEKLADNFFKN